MKMTLRFWRRTQVFLVFSFALASAYKLQLAHFYLEIRSHFRSSFFRSILLSKRALHLPSSLYFVDLLFLRSLES